MIFEYWKHPATNNLTISLEIEGSEFESVELTGLDRALFRECEKSNTIADKFLALETLIRRLEEQQKRERDGKDNG